MQICPRQIHDLRGFICGNPKSRLLQGETVNVSRTDPVRQRRLSSRRCRRRAEIHKTFPDYPGAMGRRVVSFTRIIFQQDVNRLSVSRTRFRTRNRERESKWVRERGRGSYAAFAHVDTISSGASASIVTARNTTSQCWLNISTLYRVTGLSKWQILCSRCPKIGI